MGWIQALCETYDNYFAGEELQDEHPLLPVGFIEKELDLRVNLLADGSFHSAEVLEEKVRLPVPSTPMAEGRTGEKAAPYPLCEELRYAAGDLSEYSERKYDGYHAAYIAQLGAWCAAPESPPELGALLVYLEQGRLVRDLIAYGVLYTGEDGLLLEKWQDRKNAPAFFGLGKKAAKCIVDFAVQQGDRFLPLRELRSVQESWRDRLLSSLTQRQLCYANGETEPVVYNHAKIEGNAKLISAKDDKQDFQYKGRFESAEQAYSLGYTASAKAHNTLRWLRARQGFQRYGSTFITWSTACRQRIIAPQNDAEEGWGVPDEDEGRPVADPETAYSIRVRNAMAGYRNAPEYKKGAHIVMLGMEAATNGRMSLTYYQELDGSEYLQRLEQWYTGCLWLLPRQRDGRYCACVTTPTLRELGEAVFGTGNMNIAAQDPSGNKSITKQLKSFNAELLSCIANGRPVPVNAAASGFRRACAPLAFTDKNGKWQRYDWLRCLAVACAMQKSNNEEGFKVGLNKNEPDASYLFGRLMAVADCVEIQAMAGSDLPHRQTNAIRYFGAVQQRPGATWANVEQRLRPYLTKLRGEAKFYTDLLDEIYGKFEDKALLENKQLSPYFLQGYHCQREAILMNKKEK